MNDIKVTQKSIADLIPYSRNPRRNDEAVPMVMNSINEFGFKVPIVIDKNNIIVCGHTRFKAALKLGLETVPCIVADDLSDEQIKAFRLADNKVSEKSEWDFEILSGELDDIINIDMDSFGFESIEFEEYEDYEDYEHEVNQQETQRRVENIVNLEYGQFDGEGKYDIPKLEPVTELPPISEWIGFNYVLSDNDPTGKAVHFFIDDYQFERIWNNPQQYVEKLRQYVCVATPDFSPYGDMPLATQIFNIYRKAWVGAFLQSQGITVIPTVRASTDPRSMEFYLDGIPKNSIVLISNMWTKDKEARKYFIEHEYKNMIDKLHPSKVLVYGKYMDELKDDDVEYIETFLQGRWGK